MEGTWIVESREERPKDIHGGYLQRLDVLPCRGQNGRILFFLKALNWGWWIRIHSNGQSTTTPVSPLEISVLSQTLDLKIVHLSSILKPSSKCFLKIFLSKSINGMRFLKLSRTDVSESLPYLQIKKQSCYSFLGALEDWESCVRDKVWFIYSQQQP